MLHTARVFVNASVQKIMILSKKDSCREIGLIGKMNERKLKHLCSVEHIVNFLFRGCAIRLKDIYKNQIRKTTGINPRCGVVSGKQLIRSLREVDATSY